MKLKNPKKKELIRLRYPTGGTNQSTFEPRAT